MMRAIVVTTKKKVRKALNIVVKRKGRGPCDPHPLD
jgi:hypothetical protein